MINTSYIQPIINYNPVVKKTSQQPSVSNTTSSDIKYVYNYDNPENRVHTSWFYLNDLHGKMTRMERIYGMSKEFDSIPANQRWEFFKNIAESNISKFKVASGDIVIGTNQKNNTVAGKFLDWCGFVATALGNHEMDIVEPGDLANLLKNTKSKMLALNVDVKPNSPLNGRFEKSTIVEKNGEKYGIIGIAPSDMFDRVKPNNSLNDISVRNLDDTIALIQQEIDKFKAQGINKIVLLSHSGLNNDKKIVKNTDGIDIIFSAHTHDLIKGIKEGENLLYSKSGEPVVITQAGKNGDYIGILNVDFDQNGIIRKAQNNVIKVEPYNRPLHIKYSVENIIGKPEIVGRVKSTVKPPKNVLIENNPHGNIIVDAMKNELGTDIGILNAANIRGYFSQGPVDSRLLADISPFEDKMMILELSEKQIVDAIKHGCKSIPNNTKPGILLVSGLRYKCNKQGDLLELEYIDKENKSHKIDVNNPREDKKYTVAADDFFAMGGDNYLPNNEHPDFIIKTFDYDKDRLACEYIKKLDQPFEVKPDDRIQIVD